MAKLQFFFHRGNTELFLNCRAHSERSGSCSGECGDFSNLPGSAEGQISPRISLTSPTADFSRGADYSVLSFLPCCCPPCLCGCKQILGNKHQEELGVCGVIPSCSSSPRMARASSPGPGRGSRHSQGHPGLEKELWVQILLIPQEGTPPVLCCQGLAVSITPTSHRSCILGCLWLQDRADTSRAHLGLRPCRSRGS